MESKAYRLALEMSDQLRTATFERTVVEEKLVFNGLNRSATGNSAVSIKDLKWTNVEISWMQDYSNPALLFVIKVLVPTMKMYNILWYRPISKKSSEIQIIKELVDKNLLYRTEVPGIYLINPLKLWRGNPIICVEETKILLRDHRKVSVELVIDRRPKDKYEHYTQEDRFNKAIGDDTHALDQAGTQPTQPSPI